MTYLAIRKSTCALVEYSQSTPQTISSGTNILWDTNTKRTTGGDSISINSSTGVITLDSSRRYWLQANITVDRNGLSNFELEFQTGAGGALTQADGSFPILYIEDTNKPFINSSFMASLMISYPSTNYKLCCISVNANSTLESQSHLFIMELS